VTIVGWGSTKLVTLDAISIINEKFGKPCNYLQLIFMEPFPVESVAEILNNAQNVILVENNATAQLGDLIRQKTGFEITNKVLKYDGRQFFRDELVEEIKSYI